MFADLGHFNKRAIQVRDLKELAFMLDCSSRMFIDGYVCCLSMGYLLHTLSQRSVLQSLLTSLIYQYSHFYAVVDPKKLLEFRLHFHDTT